MKVNISKYGKDRKVKVKIHGYDTWNLDSTLAQVIAPGLRKFRENLHGWPGEFSLNADGEIDEELQATALARWEEILDKMIWSFERMNHEDWPGYEPSEWARVQEGIDLFAKYYMSLWN